MPHAAPVPVTVPIDAAQSVGGLWLAPAGADVCFVFAHGAGAGMAHPFMAAFAQGLAERKVATLRFNFPSMERGSRRVDSPAVAQATVRGAVLEAGRRLPGIPLIAGGKSFGGRMTSQAQADRPLPGVVGLAFIGFPLHPAGKPSIERAEHLRRVDVPMLFLQGTRDALADLDLLRPQVDGLGARATLSTFDGADHSFHVPARTGRTDRELLADMLDALIDWLAQASKGA